MFTFVVIIFSISLFLYILSLNIHKVGSYSRNLDDFRKRANLNNNIYLAEKGFKKYFLNEKNNTKDLFKKMLKVQEEGGETYLLLLRCLSRDLNDY